MREEGWEFQTMADSLVFRTNTFRAEKGSVLHSGIYNREMASILVSSVVAGALMVIAAFLSEFGAVHYIAGVVIFIAGFLLFRNTVFRERPLEVNFSREKGIMKISWPGLMSGNVEEYPVKHLQGVEMTTTKISPENPDGIKVVEKIALQHGTVIPGFGEELVLYNAVLLLNDGTERTIYSGKDIEAAKKIIGTISEYLANA